MKPSDMTVGLIGIGTVGTGWATFFAVKGLRVYIYDTDSNRIQKGLEQAAGQIQYLITRNLTPPGVSAEEITARIQPTDSLEAAASTADFVQESTAETYDVKKAVFAALDRASPPDTILASSSSGLLMSEIQTAVQNPERCLIAHPFNPPHLVPLVELVPGKDTVPKTVEYTKNFFEHLGKTPVVLKQETPGHIANRLAAALWREAIDLVLRGVADVEDVDKALCAGPGLRWAFMGQHLIYHLGGGEGGLAAFMDHLAPAMEVWWQSLAEWKTLPPEAEEKLIAGVKAETAGRDIQDLMKWRDEKLVEVLRAVRD